MPPLSKEGELYRPLFQLHQHAQTSENGHQRHTSTVTSTPAMHRPPRFREFARQTKYASILFLNPITYFTILLPIRIPSLILFGVCAKQFINFRHICPSFNGLFVDGNFLSSAHFTTVQPQLCLLAASQRYRVALC